MILIYRRFRREHHRVLGTSLSTMLSFLFGAITTKIIATVSGPQGVAIYNQVRQLIQTSALVATSNGHNAAVQLIASSAPKSKRSVIFSLAVVYTTGAVTIAAGALLFGSQLVRFSLGSDGVAISVNAMVISVALIATVFGLYLTAVMTAIGRTHALALMRIISAMFISIFAYHAADRSSVQSYINLLLVGALATVLLGIWLLREEILRVFLGLLNGLSGKLYSAVIIKRFFPFALASLVTGISGGIMNMYLRLEYAKSYGIEAAGIFSAAWTFSSVYLMVPLSALSVHYLPLLVKFNGDIALGSLVRRVFRAVVIVGTILIIGAILCRNQIVSIFYSQDFAAAGDILRWLQLGDLFKIVSWVFGMLIISRGDSRIFLASELAQYATLSGLVAFFIAYSTEIAGVAYLAVNVVYLIFVISYGTRVCSVRLYKAEWLMLMASVLLIGLVSLMRW